MKPVEMAIEILQKTNDGEDLSPGDLSLLQSAVNHWLTEPGEVAFYALHRSVLDGYVKPWFHGIQHLTIGHIGYVRWKGVEIEHYTPSWAYSEQARIAALELKRRCEILESKGVEISTRSVIWNWD